MNKELHVVFGASGGLGNAVVRELVNQGKSVRGVNRKGIADVPKEVELAAADIMSIADAISASEGATHIYNCVNTMYDKWHLIYPEVANIFIDLLKM